MRIAKTPKKVKTLHKKEVVITEQQEKITMLSAIEAILLIAEDSSFTLDIFEELKEYLKYISDLQGISISQALLFSIFVEGCSDGNTVTVSNLARFLDCPSVRVMKYHEEIEDMVKRKLLRKVKNRFSDEKVGYVVPMDVMDAIKNDSRFVPKSLKAKDGVQFFHMVFDLTHRRKEEEIDTEQLLEEFQQLLEANEELRYVKQLERLKLPINSQVMVTQMARHLVLDQDNYVTIDSFGFLFDDKHEAYCELRHLEQGNHILIKKNLVEYDGEEGFFNKAKYKLTNTAREKLLKGFSLPKKTETNVQAIQADSIIPKSLFFNEDIGRQMEDLAELLSVEKLTAIQTRLKEHGRRTGFACLFYGAPGTGKTESVLQIARTTGRDIILVDISEIKSKWVGESEQNIKAVFDNYRAMCKNSDIMPILLFNEADAILGTRKGQAIHAVDKMENAIQNIVLQELETLDGILIATTNLEQNLDSAFERRFIYKVRFERPNVEQRRRIWLSMMPSLSEEMALQLAATFDLSGGQIENIVRKCDVESILYGESAVDAEKIQRFCQEEKIQKASTVHVGFV